MRRTWPGTAVRTRVASGVKGAGCTNRPPGTKAWFMWHMYMRSMGAPPAFSTSMAMSKSAEPGRSVTEGRAR